MVKDYQNGVIAQILEAIISQVNFDDEPISDIGNILLSVLEQTPYDKELKSVLAELFLKLKNKLEGDPFEPYDKEPESVLAEILLSILNKTEYTDPPSSRIGELLLELKAEIESYAELTASGSIANFTTTLIKPLVNLTAYVNAQQESGTPTPSNPLQITGVSEVKVYHNGANLWDGEYENGSIDSDTGRNYDTSTSWRSKNYIPIKPRAELYVSSISGLSGNTIRPRFYDINKNYIGFTVLSGSGAINRKFTAPDNAYYFRFSPSKENCPDHDISLNYPHTDTEYHAYNGSTTLINLGGTYYGGYVSQDKDGKRELTVTHRRFVIDNNLLSSAGWFESFYQIYFSNALSDFKAKYISTAVTCLCDKLKAVSTDGRGSNIGNFIALISSGNGVGLSIPDCTTQEQAEAFIQNNEIILVYELAEPFTVALPDGEPITAFNGVNNIYNDSGDTSVTYLALISDNITRGAKARAIKKAEQLKLKEQEKQAEIIDPIETKETKDTKSEVKNE